MSRDKAYEAVENFFEDSDAARTFAVEIVDAAFAAVGFDPDKTYYEIDWIGLGTLNEKARGHYRYELERAMDAGVLVEVGKGDSDE